MARTNLFEEGFNQQQALVAGGTIENQALITVVTSLEDTGLKQIGEGKLTAQRFAEAMHQVYTQIADLEVVPPLDEDQTSKFAGKVATFGAMREAAQTKPSKKRGEPTNTNKVDTDDSKA